MKFYEWTSWLERSAGRSASGAASAVQEGGRAVERAELEAKLKSEAEAQRKQRELMAQKEAQIEQNKMNLYHAARRKAAQQLESYGIPVTPESVKKQVDSKFSWANQQFVASQQRMRVDAIDTLMKAGQITATMPQEEIEVKIQDELKRRQSEEAMKAGNYQLAKALQTEADWILEHGQLPPLPTKELPMPEAAFEMPWLYEPQVEIYLAENKEEIERYQEYERQLIETQAEIKAMPWYKQWFHQMRFDIKSGQAPEWYYKTPDIMQWLPGNVAIATAMKAGLLEKIEKVDMPFMLRTRYEKLKAVELGGRIELSLADKEYIALYEEQHGEMSKAELIAATSVGYSPAGMFYRWTQSPIKHTEELKKAYYESAGIAEVIAESLATPLSAALFAIPAAGPARAGLAAKSARLARATGLTGRTVAGVPIKRGLVSPQVARVGVETIRGALLPAEMIESGFKWVFSKHIRNFQWWRLQRKWSRLPPEAQAELKEVLRKIHDLEPLNADDMARAKAFDRKWGEALEATKPIKLGKAGPELMSVDDAARAYDKAVRLTDERVLPPILKGIAKTMPTGMVKPPQFIKTRGAAQAEFDAEFFNAILDSPLDVSATAYWKTGDFERFIREMPDLGELKLKAFSDEVVENLDEIRKLRQMAVDEIDEVNESVSATFRPKEADEAISNLNNDIKYFDDLIKRLTGGQSLTLEDAAKLGIATRTTKGGKLVPAIRKSGFYVTEEFANYPHFDDIGTVLAYTSDPTRRIQAMDGGYFGQALQKYVLWPTRRTVHARLRFSDTYKYGYYNTLKKYNAFGFGKRGMRKAAGDVLEHISKDDLGKSAAELAKEPQIMRFIVKFSLPERRAIINLAKETRRFFDDMIDMQNLARAKRGQELIPYRENYRPWIAERNIRAKLFGLQPRKVIDEAPLPDFIKPNMPRNPRALVREGGMMGYDMERDLQVLAFDYIETAAKDIFNPNIIQNAKIHASVLRELGYGNSARLLEDWAMQSYAGLPTPFTKGIRTIIPRPALSGMLFVRRQLTRAVFPLNWKWNIFIQTSSIALTNLRYGTANTIRGLAYITEPTVKSAIRENCYTPLIKMRRGGKVAAQDLGASLEKQMALEKSKLDTVEDGANFLTSTIEEKLTGISCEAARQDGIRRLGLKGRALWEYASEGGAKTQSMYNLEDLPGVLASKEVGAIAPFQTFCFEVLNNMRELNIIGLRKVIGRTGAYHTTSAASALGQATVQRRTKMLFEFLASIWAINVVADKAINRKPWQASSFLPFYALIVGGANAGNPWNDPLPRKYTSDFWNGVMAVIQYENWDKLRDFVIKYHFIGGTQIDRTLRGLIAVLEGRVTDVAGRELFEVKPEEWLTAISLGIYDTEGGEEYIERLQEAKGGRVAEFFGVRLPKMETIQLTRARDRRAKQHYTGKKWVELNPDEKNWLIKRYPDLKPEVKQK